MPHETMPTTCAMECIRHLDPPGLCTPRTCLEMTALVQSIAGWNSVAAQIRSNEVVGFVPTMGALHKGHGALLKEARSRCSVVVASIFVNPIQFNHRSDYALYPRVFDEDVAFCDTRAVDYIFAPPDDEMYPQPQRVFVEVGADDSQC